MRHLLAVFLIVLSGALHAAPSKSDVVRFLGTIHALPGMRAHMSELGFRGENLELAMQHIENVLGDRRVAGFLADQIKAAGMGTLVDPRSAAGLIEPLLDRGMSHLSPAELAYFYKVEKTVIDAMNRRDCGMAFREVLTPDVMAQRTARVAARLNTPALKEYYRIQLKAARIGAQRGPKRISAGQAQRVRTRLLAELQKGSAGQRNGAQLMATLSNLRGANNGAACDAGRYFLDTVMAMEPRARHETLVAFSSGR